MHYLFEKGEGVRERGEGMGWGSRGGGWGWGGNSTCAHGGLLWSVDCGVWIRGGEGKVLKAGVRRGRVGWLMGGA